MDMHEERPPMGPTEERDDPAASARDATTRPRRETMSGPLGIALSGGGFRAALFHAGTLLRLNASGDMAKAGLISSVSGGSITAGLLAARWDRLRFGTDGVATNLAEEVVAPLLAFTARTIDWTSVLRSWFLGGTASGAVAAQYDRRLFHGMRLSDLPGGKAPTFVFCATHLETGTLFRFSRKQLTSYRVGYRPGPDAPLAVAVAASSAFPPFLSPLVLRFARGEWRATSDPERCDLHREPYTRRMTLTDGGVFDNLGLEPILRRQRPWGEIVVSDGGKGLEPATRVSHFWPLHLKRVVDTIDRQVRAQRSQALVRDFKRGERRGAFFSIRGDITKQRVPDPFPCPVEATRKLADLPTRLRGLPLRTRQQLVNWGFAMCDAAIRYRIAPGQQRPAQLPFPEAGVGG